MSGKICVAKTDADGWGNYVAYYPDGESKYLVIFAHLKEKPTYLSSGDTVKAGDRIGEMGGTGFSTGIHLHYEIQTRAFDSSKSLDPIKTKFWDNKWVKS